MLPENLILPPHPQGILTIYMYVYICVCVCVYIYIHTFIHREKVSGTEKNRRNNARKVITFTLNN